MFKNYLKISFRNLLKNRLISAINILGLAIGIAVCLLIGLFISHEWNYDQFHQEKNNLYRVYMVGKSGSYSSTSFQLGPAMETSFPEVISNTRLTSFEDFIRNGDNTFQERVHLADPAFLSMFDFEILEKNGENPLSARNKVLLTESMAKKTFGDENPLNQFLNIRIGDEWQEFAVSGILKNLPSNSSLKFNILISALHADDLYSERFLSSWFGTMPETYILTNGQISGEALEAKIPSMMKQALGDNYDPNRYKLALQSMTDIHLNPSIGSEEAISANPRYSYILAGIALMILGLACINYTTLALGRSLSRAREVGVRKVVGAGKRHILFQFWGESIMVAMISTGLGLVMADLFLPLLNQITDLELQITLNAFVVGAIAVMAVVIGVISGSYPAIILSRFAPIEIIRGKLKTGREKNWIIRGMVTFQFVLTIGLIASTLVMWEQMQYIRDKDLGFDRDQIISLSFADRLSANTNISQLVQNSQENAGKVMNALGQIPEVQKTGYSIHQMGGQGWVQYGYENEDQDVVFFNANVINEGFISTMGLEIISGNDFSKERPSDQSTGVIVNKAYIKQKNLEDPIGKPLSQPFNEYKIIAVVKNFNYQSFHHQIDPAILLMNPEKLQENAGYVSIMEMPTPRIFVRIGAGNISETIGKIETVWEKTASGHPFTLSFLDQHLASHYASEMKMSKLLSITSILILVVAVMGLFGMIALSVNHRTKEIGLRKVLGASVADIIKLIGREFSMVIAIAMILAIPLAYFSMDYWLQDFAVRISIGPWSFILAGITVLLIAMLTMGAQSLKAAQANPASILRDE